MRTQVESLQKAGIGVQLLVLDGHARKVAYVRGLCELRRRLRERRIDLVHAHYSYAGVLARSQWKIPVVVTYHGDDLLGTVGRNGRLTRTSRLAVALGRALARVVDAAIVVNAEMARRLRPTRASIIPCAVDLELFAPAPREEARRALGLDPHKKYLLFAADPQIPVKRFPLAAEVAAHLTSEDPSIELLVVYREPQPQLCLFMNACDALIFPSFQEGSPTIVKQAMACNLPILATDVGDVRELIGGTEGCHICEPMVFAFVDAAREVLRNPHRTNGRAAVKQLDAAAIATQVIQVYESVLQGSTRRATQGTVPARIPSGPHS